LIALIAGFLFGFDTVVISEQIKKQFFVGILLMHFMGQLLWEWHWELY
jgi:hypothetical protein